MSYHPVQRSRREHPLRSSSTVTPQSYASKTVFSRQYSDPSSYAYSTPQEDPSYSSAYRSPSPASSSPYSTEQSLPHGSHHGQTVAFSTPQRFHYKDSQKVPNGMDGSHHSPKYPPESPGGVYASQQSPDAATPPVTPPDQRELAPTRKSKVQQQMLNLKSSSFSQYETYKSADANNEPHGSHVDYVEARPRRRLNGHPSAGTYRAPMQNLPEEQSSNIMDHQTPCYQEDPSYGQPEQPDWGYSGVNDEQAQGMNMTDQVQYESQESAYLSHDMQNRFYDNENYPPYEESVHQSTERTDYQAPMHHEQSSDHQAPCYQQEPNYEQPADWGYSGVHEEQAQGMNMSSMTDQVQYESQESAYLSHDMHNRQYEQGNYPPYEENVQYIPEEQPCQTPCYQQEPNYEQPADWNYSGVHEEQAQGMNMTSVTQYESQETYPAHTSRGMRNRHYNPHDLTCIEPQQEPEAPFSDQEGFFDWAKFQDPMDVADIFDNDPSVLWEADRGGNNLLHAASEVGNISLVNFLLKNISEADAQALLDGFNHDGLKPFHVAVSNGMCHILRSFIEFSPQLAQETTREGSTAVHLAVQANCRAALSFLVSVLDQDFIWSRDASGATPLHLACVEGSAALVLDLLRVPGANVNSVNGQGQSCLQMAITLEDLKLCKTLLSLEHPMRPAIEQTDQERNTALHYACSNQQYSIVKLLLEHGANAQARNKMKLTPVEVADNDETIELMIRKHLSRPAHRVLPVPPAADRICRNSSHNLSFTTAETVTTLDDSETISDDLKGILTFSSSEEGEEEVEQLVLEHAPAPARPPPSTAQKKKDLHLFHMIKSGCNIPELESVIGSAQRQLKRNVNLIRDSESGGTLLHLAAKIGYLNVVQFLVEGAGAEVDCQDDHGMTPLHCAVESRELLIVRYLVKFCGARLDVKDRDGNTAKDVASEVEGDDDDSIEDIVRLLEKATSKPPSKRRLVEIPRVKSSLP